MSLTLDYFMDENLKLYQDKEHFRFNTDTKLLAKFVHLKKQERILDIGTNNAALLVYFDQFNVKELVGVEILEETSKVAQKNADMFIKHPVKIVNQPIQRYEDDMFDVTLLFGPMYHLHGPDEKLQALMEAKRVTKPGGRILVAYIMNEYSVITYAIKERHILEGIKEGMLDEQFHCTEKANPLYSFVRLEDMERLNEQAGLIRQKVIAADGAANYIRPFLNALTEEEFDAFIRYHMSTCERMDLMGASGHTVDILTK